MDREEILQLLRDELDLVVEAKKDYDGDYKVTIVLRVGREEIDRDSFYITRPSF
jgi:hypothetical protein